LPEHGKKHKKGLEARIVFVYDKRDISSKNKKNTRRRIRIMGILLTGGSALGSGGLMIIIYMVVIFGLLYFMSIRPQKKEQKRISAMLASMEIGDSILTNSGFYGVIIDIDDDTVIVEFGSNKNCRIPMQKGAIVQVEKAGE
jgi:preprotein translocase subunit YajC